MVKEKIIVCENVSYRYETVNDEEQAKAVKDVSFSVDRGSFVAILGRNGSGKSTLAKLLNGVLLPQTGRVLADGLDTADEDKIQTIRKKFGMVFQNPDNQLVSNLVEEDVAFGPENLGLPSEEIRKRVDQALKIVGMEAYAGHSPHKLSGGQKQRIAIAGVLAMMPECIIFDESTAMLDPHGRREIMETILKLNREKKLTVILITHHMDEAVQADRVVVMENGKIVRDGTPREVFSDVPFLHAAGLDAPQATEIVHLISEDAYFQNKTTFPKGILTEEEAAEFIIGLFGKR